MPIYEYRCSSCGHQQEFLQKVSDTPLTVCTQCGKETFSKMLTAAGFQLKGSGWYATDFKNKPSAPAKSGDAKSGDTKSGDAKSGDTKSGDAKSGDSTSAESKPSTEGKSSGGKESAAPASGSGTPST
jgi:putative FmdB family regulatory protein